MRNAPNFAIYNVGDYTFAPWKVIWPEMCGSFYAAVASEANVPGFGRRPYVPDHKVYFVPFNEKREAMYLCGMLNAPQVREWIESHIVKLQIGNVFKHTRLPEFDLGDARHRALAELVEAAHATPDKVVRQSKIRRIHEIATDILASWRPDDQ